MPNIVQRIRRPRIGNNSKCRPLRIRQSGVNSTRKQHHRRRHRRRLAIVNRKHRQLALAIHLPRAIESVPVAREPHRRKSFGQVELRRMRPIVRNRPPLLVRRPSLPSKRHHIEDRSVRRHRRDARAVQAGPVTRREGMFCGAVGLSRSSRTQKSTAEPKSKSGETSHKSILGQDAKKIRAWSPIQNASRTCVSTLIAGRIRNPTTRPPQIKITNRLTMPSES